MLHTNSTRAVRRLAAIAIVGVLALSFAAIATLGAEADVTSGRIFAWMGDYITEVGAALGGE
ncbi:MAG TPA: hypothetical protein VEK10_08295 [Steroidobacteraceae bacterium]|nr:hypothetical protein [Steroidobacteraceae bacterium]